MFGGHHSLLNSPALRRSRRGWWALVRFAWVAGLIWTLTLRAAEPAEQLAFDAAVRDFELGQWERAVRSLEEFETKFPQSALKPEAFQRRQFAGAELALAKAEYAAAATAFAEYSKTYPADSRAGVSAIREAQAHLKLGNAAAALAVLEAPEGPFAKQLASGTHPTTLYGGLLVKAEALRAAQRWVDAVAALTQADPLASSPAEKAARWQMLAGVEESAGQLEAAAQAAEEWSRSLGEDAPIERRAEASALAGRLWRKAGKTEAAEAAFVRNLAAGVPLDRQREAVLELAESALSRSDWATARERLQSFLNSQPADPQAARLRLQLGQTLFRQFLAGGGDTNPSPELLALLPLASAQFGDGLTNSPPADLAGPLRLGRGWSLWQEGVSANQADRLREAETNFALAATLLPAGLEQATARFKWADSQLRLGQPGAALTNFWWVIREYTNFPAVDATLVTPALLQAAQAGVAAGQPLESASAVEQVLTRKPTEPEAGNIALVVAQALTRAGDSTRGKALLDRFLALYPAGGLAPEAELGLASIELRSRKWTNALASLDAWVDRHTNHTLLPQAEFDRAWAAVQAGLLTNAVNQFAALSVRFPTNPISQTASLWLADYYFSEGDYLRSAQACVNVLTNSAWRGNPLWHQARLKAAESARRRQSFSDAEEQLMEILNDRSTPTNLFPSALFALGETRLEQPLPAEAPPLDNYRKALEAFTAAAQLTNSLISVAALGKMADCHLQLATRTTNSYAKADELYRRVLQSPKADLAARCKASVGLGMVAEKLADLQPALAPELLKSALNAYLDVVNGTLLHPGEKLDPWWVKEAGREAGELLERAGRWAEAAALYDRLARELPALQVAWSARAAEARKRIVP